MARIFAQLIRGEIWDTKYMAVEKEVRDGSDWHDEAVEEASIWGYLLTMDCKSVKFTGKHVLPAEFRQHLEDLVSVLESDAEYPPHDPHKEMLYFNELYPWEPSLEDLWWGVRRSNFQMDFQCSHVVASKKRKVALGNVIPLAWAVRREL
jgi:hypothetical protein